MEPAPPAAAAPAAPDAAVQPAAAASQKGEGGEKKPRGGPLVELPEDQQGLAWIQYMRFLRRNDVGASRRVRGRRALLWLGSVGVGSCLHQQ
jgi:hypothetical protein